MNGAGKTSTFVILCGGIKQTAVDAIINNISIVD